MILLYVVLSYFIYYFLLGTMTLDRNDLVDGVAWGLFAPVVVPFMLVYYIIKCTFILGEKFKNRNKK